MQAGCVFLCWALPRFLGVLVSTRLTRISGWGRCMLAALFVLGGFGSLFAFSGFVALFLACIVNV